MRSLIQRNQYTGILELLERSRFEPFLEELLEKEFGHSKIKLQKVEKRPIVYRDAKELYEEVEQKHLYRITGRVRYVGSAVTSINLELYRRLLRDLGKENILEKYQVYDRAHDQKELKALGEYAKIKGPNIDSWQLLVNIETFYGWADKLVQDEHIAEKVREWVEVPFHPNYKGSEDTFISCFKKRFAR